MMQTSTYCDVVDGAGGAGGRIEPRPLHCCDQIDLSDQLAAVGCFGVLWGPLLRPVRYKGRSQLI